MAGQENVYQASCRTVVGQLIGNPQQPVTGLRDQLRERVIKIHAITSALPR